MVLSEAQVLLTLALIIFWLAGVTFWIYKTSRHYSRLAGSTGRNDLRGILERLLDKQNEVDEHIKKVEETLGELNEKTEKHIQKIGLVRFNPFAETGGDQSFALALLAGDDSGVVILSLHGREGTRAYVKPVKAGKSRYELSREEQQAIAQAQKGK